MKKYRAALLVSMVAMRDPFFLPGDAEPVIVRKKITLVGIAHAGRQCSAILDIDGVRHCVIEGQKAAEYQVQALNEQSVELVDRGDVLKLSVV